MRAMHGKCIHDSVVGCTADKQPYYSLMGEFKCPTNCTCATVIIIIIGIIPTHQFNTHSANLHKESKNKCIHYECLYA